MNKMDLARFVAKDCRMTQEKATEVIESVLSNIVSAVADRDEKVSLKGFGTFYPQHHAKKNSINPQNPTGERIPVAPYDEFSFNPSMDLKKFKVYEMDYVKPATK